MLDVRIIPYKSKEYFLMLELRNRVLREPLGLQFDEKQLNEEANDHHIGGFLKDGSLAWCLVLSPLNEHTVKMRQVATQPNLQRTGLGKYLAKEAESLALNHNYNTIVLHARITAVDFYKKMGYQSIGDEFLEIGIPHIAMRKALL